jgi:hypothetical protein
MDGVSLALPSGVPCPQAVEMSPEELGRSVAVPVVVPDAAGVNDTTLSAAYLCGPDAYLVFGEVRVRFSDATDFGHGDPDAWLRSLPREWHGGSLTEISGRVAYVDGDREEQPIDEVVTLAGDELVEVSGDDSTTIPELEEVAESILRLRG